MSELDFGAHRKCAWCGKIQPEKRCLEYNDKFFCCIQCKIKQEELEDDSLYTRVTGNVLRFNRKR